MFKVFNTKTGIYFGDPMKSTDFQFEFDNHTGHIHKIIGSQDRAKEVSEFDANAMIRMDHDFAYIPA